MFDVNILVKYILFLYSKSLSTAHTYININKYILYKNNILRAS